jgi:hypothetical protein
MTHLRKGSAAAKRRMAHLRSLRRGAKKKHPETRKRKKSFRSKLHSVRRVIAHTIKSIKRHRHRKTHVKQVKHRIPIVEIGVIAGAIAAGIGTLGFSIGEVTGQTTQTGSISISTTTGDESPNPAPSPIPIPNPTPNQIIPVTVNPNATIMVTPSTFNTLTGTQVLVSGTGFLPNETINVIVNNSILKETATTNNAGSFSVSIPYPSDTLFASKINNNAGSFVTVGATDGVTVAQTTLSVVSTTSGTLAAVLPSAAPVMVSVNPQITFNYLPNLKMYNVTGTGFTPNGTVTYATLIYSNQWNSATNYFTTTADSSGNVTLNAAPVATASTSTPVEALDQSSGVFSNVIILD